MDSNKVLVELEWEQIDAIVRNELRDHAIMVKIEMARDYYLHPDDKKYNETLLPALVRAYDYWAGEDETARLMEELHDISEAGDATKTD